MPVLLGEFERGVVSDRLAVDADLEAVAKADYHGKIAGIVKSVAGRVGACPSMRGNVARISGRCTGPSSRRSSSAS